MAGTATISWITSANALLTVQNVDNKNATGETVHTLTSVPAGSLLVVTTGCELSGDGGIDVTISDTATLTWTKRCDATAAGGGCEIWTAPFTAGGNITVTVDWFPASNSFVQSSTCYTFINQGASPIGTATNTTVAGQNNPAVTNLTTNANSIIVVVTSDFDATDGGVNGASIVYTGSPTQDFYFRDSAHLTSVHYRYSAPTVTTYNIGWSTPASGDASMNTCTLEIKGN